MAATPRTPEPLDAAPDWRLGQILPLMQVQMQRQHATHLNAEGRFVDTAQFAVPLAHWHIENQPIAIEAGQPFLRVCFSELADLDAPADDTDMSKPLGSQSRPKKSHCRSRRCVRSESMHLRHSYRPEGQETRLPV